MTALLVAGQSAVTGQRVRHCRGHRVSARSGDGMEVCQGQLEEAVRTLWGRLPPVTSGQGGALGSVCLSAVFGFLPFYVLLFLVRLFCFPLLLCTLASSLLLSALWLLFFFFSSSLLLLLFISFLCFSILFVWFLFCHLLFLMYI